MIYSNSIADRLLGCLLINTDLCINTKYPLDKDEFIPQFHKIMYATLYNLAIRGVKHATIQDIDEFVKPYEAQYNVLKENNFMDYINVIYELADVGNYEYYYNEFRKFSCLREYQKKGFDIKKFYDVDKEEQSQLENLNQYNIDDIINWFEKQQSDVRKKFMLDSNIETMICGDGFDDFLDEVEEEPMIGAGLCSPILNSLYRGWCRGHLILRGSPSSFGKAQPINTIIPTPNGNKRLGDIKIGDYVFDRLGNPTKVLGVFPQGIIDCYKVVFSDGRITYCNDNHIWNIYRDHHLNISKRVNKTLSEIAEKMKKDTISIPVCNKIQYSEKEYNIDPYVIGSLIGNGCCKEKYLSISSNDSKQVDEVARLLNCFYKKNSDKNFTYTFKDVNGNSLKTSDIIGEYNEICCLAKDKRIPNEYKYGSIEQRLHLLQGLFDTDGSITSNTYNISYSTTSYNLALDIREVLNSLGYFCNIHKENRKDKTRNICYVLVITLPNSEKKNLFRLPRKLNIAEEAINKPQKRHYDRLSFKTITKVSPCEMVCIYVDNEEHLYLTNDYIVTHNTTMGISDQNNVSVLRVWSDEKNQYINNPYYQGKGAYIHTEQKMREEIQPRFMANISHIPYHKILDGDFTKEEKERLEEASRITKESKLKLINYPEFTANGLKELIKNLALDGYEYITFDYCWDNFYIGAELKAISGTAVRQDMSLLHLVDTLKLSAEQNNVAIATMIQLNGREKEVKIVDESCLFGSKSVKTKLDNGAIYMYPRQKELKQVDTLIAKWNSLHNPQAFGGRIEPNAVSHCFKTRYGRYGLNVKVWHYVDNSIGKMIDMFATTWDNKPIDIPPMYIERK